MSLKSSFQSDLHKEQALSKLLDKYYASCLKHYSFDRVHDKKLQMQGIDVMFVHKKSNRRFAVDEKAQLDYLNEDLPTFAFEISFEKDGKTKLGWLFDPLKATEFYALVTGIYSDSDNAYAYCKITMVNRQKLIGKLKEKGVDREFIEKKIKLNPPRHGKTTIEGLNEKREGYLFHSIKNKAEKPVNLVLRLDWLLDKKIAKRLV